MRRRGKVFPSLIVLSLVVVALPLWAQPRFEDCDHLAWDYPDQSMRSELLVFYLYIFPAGQTPVTGRPFAIIPAIETLVLVKPCKDLYLPGFGRYQAYITAVYTPVAPASGSPPQPRESGPSNTIEFLYGPDPGMPPSPGQPPIPPVNPPPIWQPPPHPQPLPLPPPVVRLPPRDEGLVTGNCAWQGTCPPGVPNAAQPHLPLLPSSSGSGTLTESCAWTGACAR